MQIFNFMGELKDKQEEENEGWFTKQCLGVRGERQTLLLQVSPEVWLREIHSAYLALWAQNTSMPFPLAFLLLLKHYLVFQKGYFVTTAFAVVHRPSHS